MSAGKNGGGFACNLSPRRERHLRNIVQANVVTLGLSLKANSLKPESPADFTRLSRTLLLSECAKWLSAEPGNSLNGVAGRAVAFRKTVDFSQTLDGSGFRRMQFHRQQALQFSKLAIDFIKLASSGIQFTRSSTILNPLQALNQIGRPHQTE